MRGARRIAALLAVGAALAVAACAPLRSAPPPAVSFGNANPEAQQLYYLVNSERAGNGLGGLGWHDLLGGLAQSWTDHMAGTGDYEHQNLDAVLQNPAFTDFSAMGENIIHGGCGLTAEQLHQAWMSSPSHAANILGNWSVVGIGVACSGGDLYATEDFGR